MFDFFEELEVFNKIKYKDSNHSYTINNKPAISGTQLIHKFEEPFDTIKIANMVAKKRNVTAQSLINEWTILNVLASIKGSYVHNYLELSFQKRLQEIDNDELFQKVYTTLEKHEFYQNPISEIENDADFISKKIIEYYNQIVPTCDQFLFESKDILLPLASEFIVGDEDYGVCGTIDQLYYNKKTKMIEIWDWKTNKAFSVDNDFSKKLKYPLQDLESCHINIYSLQLNLYKFIIEKNTKLKIGKLWLVNFAETLDGRFKYYECLQFLNYVKMMLDYHKNKKIINEVKKYEW